MTTTVLGDKLTEALNNRSVDSFIWKGPKVNGVQKDIKLVDCSYDDLLKYYNHCSEMLYNTDSKNPGRITLIAIVADQIQRCRAELLVRWFRKEQQYTNLRLYESISGIIKKNEGNMTSDQIQALPIRTLYEGLPLDYQDVPVKLVMQACLDTLGAADMQHLTISFIIKLGLWFTRQEMSQLNKIDPFTKKSRNRLEVVLEEMQLDPKIRLKINDTGLTYAEFKTIINMKRGVAIYSGITQDKYSNFTTDQLELLSKKVLYRFQQKCEEQANQWKELQSQILKVAEFKGWDLHVN